jgi:uncharacterized membrane protein
MATAEAVASRHHAQHEREEARPTPAGGHSDERLARALGWFSIGLGLTELAAPKRLGSLIGAPRSPRLIAAYGLREIATGIAILARPRQPGRLWSRVGGDVVDLATLGAAFAAGGSPARLVAATAAVAGVTMLDVHASRRLQRLEQGSRADRLEASIAIGKSRDEVYRFWRDLRNLPRFMPRLVSVEEKDQRTSRWVARAPGGASIEWDAEMTEDRPGDLIAWRTLPGASVAHAGAVRFVDAPGHRGTAVRLEMGFDPPAGPLGALAATVFGEIPKQQMQNDLRRLKQLLETGEISTTEGQSSGRRRDAKRGMQ